MTFTVGLTGGIGSGKSAASDWFAQQKICIVDADLVARQIVEKGQPALNDIEKYFGSSVIQADGTLNRAQLRQIIFNDPSAKSALEAMTHARIRAEIIQQLSSASSTYVILVSPLLFETDQHLLTQRTLLIDTTEELQKSRASQRDQQSLAQIEKVIQTQMSRIKKQQLANDIVLNSDSLETLYIQLSALHQKYLDLAQYHEL